MAARELWEYDTQRLTTKRTIVEVLDGWPDDCWRFYYRPIPSEEPGVQYYNSLNVLTTLDKDTWWTSDKPNCRIELTVGQSWPDITERWDAVHITYTAGQELVTEIEKHAIKLQIDVMFELRGTTTDKENSIKAYENLVARYQRGSYP